MDSANSTSISSTAYDIVSKEKNCSTSVDVGHETTCWGCGLQVLVSPYADVLKCGWCGAITKQNALKCENQCFKWRLLRDRCIVSVVLLFMLFFICAGIWAIYPITFSVSFFCGVFHLVVEVILSISTLSTFCLAAFQPAGAPPTIQWGSYPTVGKGGLENYTFCHYCSKPKSPRTHHCRSCRTCILDMDHHCPFIGNCVGTANHRGFILFLMSAVITVFLSARGLLLVYLFIASVSLEIGLSVLLWQQLCYIYEGKTYLSHLSVTDSEESAEKDCQNLVRFFGCPHVAAIYLPSFWKSGKSHKK